MVEPNIVENQIIALLDLDGIGDAADDLGNC
jgi:hypothetical protein